VSRTADRYQQLTATPPGRFLQSKLGLPESTPLRRYEPGQPLLEGPALIGGAPKGRLGKTVDGILKRAKVDAHKQAPEGDGRFAALVFDATGITSSEGLRELYDFFHPTIRRIAECGRLVVLGSPPEQAGNIGEQVAQRALEGFTRSAGKELSKGATAQLVYVEAGAEDRLESTLRFLLSAKSAYVDGQVIRVGAGSSTTPSDWETPLAGSVAAVTGAARGIGAAIARTLARDGAHVVCIDVQAAGESLADVANEIGGSALALDVTAKDAPEAFASYLKDRHGGAQVIVHNAGITRDKTLGRMKPELWDAVLAVNISSQERITERLLADDAVGENGRIITVSSIAGIAGNRGQTNYGTSKAAVVGLVNAYAPILAERGATINAVAPGFIETKMTAAIPLMVREAGRRMNSLSQGGQPIDVAETIAWFASPGSGGVNGNVVRVCGQSLIGA